MSRNQRRATSLARDLRSGLVNAEDLSEVDWQLLLLAADLPDPRSAPQAICLRVLENARERNGFFASGAAQAAPASAHDRYGY